MAVRDESYEALLASPERADETPDGGQFAWFWAIPWWALLAALVLVGATTAAVIVITTSITSTPASAAPPIPPQIDANVSLSILAVSATMTPLPIRSPSGNSTTTCDVERLIIRGSGPWWRDLAALVVDEHHPFAFVEVNRLPCGQPSLLATAGIIAPFGVADAVSWSSSPIDVARLLALGTNETRLTTFAVDRTAAGTAVIESRWRLQRGRGLSIPLIVRGTTPPGRAYPDRIQADLLSAIDVVMHVQDACPQVVGAASCACDPDDVLTVLEDLAPTATVRYGALLINGKAGPVRQIVEPGAVLRLRVSNAAGGTNFRLQIGTATMAPIARVIAVDGQWIDPVELDSGGGVWIAVGQRVDVLISVSLRRWQSIPVVAVEETSHDVGVPSRQVVLMLSTAGTPSAPSGVDPIAAGDPGRMDWSSEVLFHQIATPPLPPRPLTATPERAVVLGLYDNNTIAVDGAVPLRRGARTAAAWSVRLHERVNVTLVNCARTGLAMRLYGHVFDVVEIDGGVMVRGARRDTLMVPPRRNATIRFVANNPGRWSIACLDQIRYELGMIATFQYND